MFPRNFISVCLCEWSQIYLRSGCEYFLFPSSTKLFWKCLNCPYDEMMTSRGWFNIDFWNILIFIRQFYYKFKIIGCEQSVNNTVQDNTVQDNTRLYCIILYCTEPSLVLSCIHLVDSSIFSQDYLYLLNNCNFGFIQPICSLVYKLRSLDIT